MITVQLFESTICERALRLEETIEKHFSIDSKTGYIEIFPEQKTCSHCGNQLRQYLKTNSGVLLTSIIMNALIYVSKCKTDDCTYCDKEISFQGQEFGYVNYKNNMIIPVERIIQYMDMYGANGVPFDSWWKSNYIKPTEAMQRLPRYEIKRKWETYSGYIHEAFVLATELFRYPMTAFKCCNNPRRIAMDGVVISIKTKQMPILFRPWLNGIIYGQATNRGDRQFEKINPEDAKILNTLLDGGHVTEVTVNTWRTNKNICLRIISFCVVEQDHKYFIHERAKTFVRASVKKINTASNLMPYASKCIIERHVYNKKLSQ